MNRFLHLVLLNLMIWFGGVVGLILLVIPGIWWFIATGLSLQIFLLKKTDSVEALKTSMDLVKGRWWNIAGLMILCGLVNLAGTICFLVGLLISVPLSTMAVYVAAEKLLQNSTVVPPPTTSLSEASAEIPSAPQ